MAEHIAQFLADLAWEQYEAASQYAARYLRGDQLELFDLSGQYRAEWLGIALACEAEAARHG